MSSNNDDIELKSLNSKKESKYSIKLASEEQLSDDESNNNEETFNDEERQALEEQPFLIRNEENIEMHALNEENNDEIDENHIEATSLVQTNNLDAIDNENTSLNQDLDEINPQERNKLQRIRKYLSTNNPYVRGFKPTKIKLVALLIFSCIAFVFIFFPNCISSIDYHHIALTRNKWTGTVNDKKVYYPGLHFLLPWKEFITFDSTVKHLNLNNMPIFTTDKLEVKTSFRVYYFIDRQNIGKLYRKFGDNFIPIVNRVITSELMNAGQIFSIEDFKTKRNNIKTYLKEKLTKRLKNDYQMNLFDLYFSDLKFTPEIDKLNLLRTLNGIYNEKAVYDRITNITIAETKLQIESIRNEARIILSQAEANAYNETLKKEKINYDFRIESVHSSMLNNSLDKLGFYQQDKQTVNRQFISKRILSFCYLSSLINHDKLVFYSRNGDSIFSA